MAGIEPVPANTAGASREHRGKIALEPEGLAFTGPSPKGAVHRMANTPVKCNS